MTFMAILALVCVVIATQAHRLLDELAWFFITLAFIFIIGGLSAMVHP